MKKFFELFYVFFKLGLFTFGGGYAMIPQIKEQIVEKKKWLTSEEMLEIIAISESTPGPIAINMATFIGYRQKKILGSVMATLGVVLPSLIIIFIISLFFDAFLANKYVGYAFLGIKTCVAFLITKAGFEMFVKMKKNIFNCIIFSLIFILMIVFELLSVNFSSILFILSGGVISIIIYSLTSLKLKKELKEDNEKWFIYIYF